MRRSDAILLLLGLASLLMACGSGERSGEPRTDPLLCGYGQIRTWYSGSIRLEHPSHEDVSGAVEVASIQAELDAIRDLPCSCGSANWGSLVHRRLPDPREPEKAVVSQWVLICRGCKESRTAMFRVPTPPEDYDRFFYEAQGYRKR